MAKLAFNLESVAGIRDKAGIPDADPVKAVFLAELGGVEAVVCPIQEEFRPLTEKDVKLLRSLTRVKFNARVPISDKPLGAALSIRPDGITLLSKGTADATPQGGMNFTGREDELGRIVRELKAQDTAVSCFVDPVLAQIKSAAAVGMDGVELNLRVLTSARNSREQGEAFEELTAAALAACKLGLDVSVSGGITYQNAAFLAGIEKVDELIVGRAIVGRALFIGMEQAVRDMAALVH